MQMTNNKLNNNVKVSTRKVKTLSEGLHWIVFSCLHLSPHPPARIRPRSPSIVHDSTRSSRTPPLGDRTIARLLKKGGTRNSEDDARGRDAEYAKFPASLPHFPALPIKTLIQIYCVVRQLASFFHIFQSEWTYVNSKYLSVIYRRFRWMTFCHYLKSSPFEEA